MIQASRSRSNSPRAGLAFAAGPLEIVVDGSRGPTLELLSSTLALYDVPWTLTPSRPVQLVIDVVPDTVTDTARGDYLVCAQMLVDHANAGLRATTSRGAALAGDFDGIGEAWRMTVPSRIETEGWWPEIEDLVSLVVTTGWRRAGWIPLHAAGLASGDRGVLVCAASRGGKTTFSLAMARRGWRIVGDDKLLLGSVDGADIVAAVKHMLNVDPAIRGWFAEVPDLTDLPLYSEWSPKRRVALSSVFADAAQLTMGVTDVIVLERGSAGSPLSVEPLDVSETASALLHQTVIPTDRHLARQIITTMARFAHGARGLRVEIPEGAYGDADALTPVERALA